MLAPIIIVLSSLTLNYRFIIVFPSKLIHIIMVKTFGAPRECGAQGAVAPVASPPPLSCPARVA